MKIIKRFPPLGSEFLCLCRDWVKSDLHFQCLSLWEVLNSSPFCSNTTKTVRDSNKQSSHKLLSRFLSGVGVDMAWGEKFNLSVIRINSLLVSLICINKIIFIISTIIKIFSSTFNDLGFFHLKAFTEKKGGRKRD